MALARSPRASERARRCMVVHSFYALCERGPRGILISLSLSLPSSWSSRAHTRPSPAMSNVIFPKKKRVAETEIARRCHLFIVEIKSTMIFNQFSRALLLGGNFASLSVNWAEGLSCSSLIKKV